MSFQIGYDVFNGFELASWRKNSAYRQRRCRISNPESTPEKGRSNTHSLFLSKAFCSFKVPSVGIEPTLEG